MHEDEARLNPFGWYLWQLMLARGVDSVEELSDRMREVGYDFDAEEIRGYMHDPTTSARESRREEER